MSVVLLEGQEPRELRAAHELLHAHKLAEMGPNLDVKYKLKSFCDKVLAQC